MLETRNEELELAYVGMLDLKHKIEYLENKDKCNKGVESTLRTKLSEVEETLKAYKIAANASKIVTRLLLMPQRLNRWMIRNLFWIKKPHLLFKMFLSQCIGNSYLSM